MSIFVSSIKMVICTSIGMAICTGCGGSSSSPPAASPGSGGATTVNVKVEQETATGSTLTEFQKSRLLGHYSTADGASGFILDRTVTPWRAKLDGVNKVVTLAATSSEGSDGKDYASADKSIWIRVSKEYGDVQLFQGPKQHEGVDIVRDADANQLK